MFCIEMHWERLMMAAAMNFAIFFYYYLTSLRSLFYNVPVTLINPLFRISEFRQEPVSVSRFARRLLAV